MGGFNLLKLKDGFSSLLLSQRLQWAITVVLAGYFEHWYYDEGTSQRLVLRLVQRRACTRQNHARRFMK